MRDSPAAPVRVAINDDYELVVAGVATLLAAYADRVEVVELDSNEPTASDVDVILYDTFGQDQGANIDVAGVSVSGKPKVVVFSWNVQPELVDGAISNGAAGYLWKGMPVADMVDAIEKIHAGEEVTPPKARTGCRTHRTRGRGRRSHHPGVHQPGDRRQGLPEHQLGQDLHPHRVPQDGRPTTFASGRVGSEQRVRA
jgi:DNA-binding NarL/FixJ family response regulator